MMLNKFSNGDISFLELAFCAFCFLTVLLLCDLLLVTETLSFTSLLVDASGASVVGLLNVFFLPKGEPLPLGECLKLFTLSSLGGMASNLAEVVVSCLGSGLGLNIGLFVLILTVDVASVVVLCCLGSGEGLNTGLGLLGKVGTLLLCAVVISKGLRSATVVVLGGRVWTGVVLGGFVGGIVVLGGVVWGAGFLGTFVDADVLLFVVVSGLNVVDLCGIVGIILGGEGSVVMGEGLGFLVVILSVVVVAMVVDLVTKVSVNFAKFLCPSSSATLFGSGFLLSFLGFSLDVV